MGAAIAVQDHESEETINLSNQGLTTLPFRISNGHPVRFLNLANNMLKTLPRNLTQLQQLNLSKNSIKDLKKFKKSLLTYSKLNSLDFTGNQLTTWTIDLPTLRILNLSLNRFTMIPNIADNLNTLILDYNHISTFKFSSPSLVNLSLSMNNIEQIDPSVRMPNLYSLNLSLNSIHALPDEFTQMFPVLSVLNVEGNLLEAFPAKYPKNLVELNIAHNNFVNFDYEFTCLEKLFINDNKIPKLVHLPKSLGTLICYSNEIAEIEPSDFSYLFLDARNNKIFEIPKFNCISEMMFLSNNHIRSLSNITTFGNQLSVLYCQSNEIEVLPDEIFALPNLRKLFLSNNKIKTIPDALTNSKIISMWIGNNPLEKIPTLPVSMTKFCASYCNLADVSNLFTTSHFIGLLDLSGNQLKSLPLLESLEVLYLSKNNFEEFPPLSKKIVTLDLSCNNITSIPENALSLTIRNLNLAWNKITSIPNFTKYPNIQYLKLTGNPTSDQLYITATGQDPNITKNANSLYCVVDTIDIAETNITFKKPENSIIREILTSTCHEAPYKRLVMQRSCYAEMVGLRAEMEDSIMIRDDIGLYALLDGHSTALVAGYGAHSFSTYFDLHPQFTIDNVRKAISCVQNDTIDLKINGGATCVLCYRKEDNLIVANIGDSRALIARRDGKAKSLTSDHKPINRKEFLRIGQEWGFVHDERLEGELAVARTLGDNNLRTICHEPDVDMVELEPNMDKYLIIACDGVFDVLENDQVSEIAIKSSTPCAAAYNIRNIAYANGSEDNISVLVVDLYE